MTTREPWQWLVLLSVSTHCELLHVGLWSVTTTRSLWCRMKTACSTLTTLQSNTDRQTQSVPLHDSSSFLWQLLSEAGITAILSTNICFIIHALKAFLRYSHPFNTFISISQYNKIPNSINYNGMGSPTINAAYCAVSSIKITMHFCHYQW